MQYVLTQAEYDALTPVKRLQDRNEALEKAKEIILQESEFICIHDPSVATNNRIYRGYCDDCPIGNIHKVDMNVSRYICELPKNYSK